MRRSFHQTLYYKELKNNVHNDLGKSGVKKDNNDVKAIIKILKENYPSILE